MPPIRPELLDELLTDYQKPEDMLGTITARTCDCVGLTQKLEYDLIESAYCWIPCY